MQFVIATHNPHKCEELARILAPLGITAVLNKDLPEVEETGETFLSNAFLKADSACDFTGLPAIADDSGLMVDALDGAPGVYSARFAGETGTYADCNRKLLDIMKEVPVEQRTARFASVIACVFPNGDVVTAEGVCDGAISFEVRGEGGFGYDPLFVVGDKSFAEMTPAEKDAVSHRGKAMRAFAKELEAYLATHKIG
ncbi:MAG: RdgB/HAM1 family non-canonical purine NTP pyrophosphatase [Clostridia bacterium]|nr:RdgB/HAM1 family non-canonical purine NTP pyrophosphatase [Clostridia bacterium]